MKKLKLLALASLLLTAVTATAQISEIGMASFYADKFEGKTTASGEVFKQSKLTAAHRTLPFGSVVKVTNLNNNLSVTVTINDRGPFVDKRIIDLSRAAAEKLKFIDKGTTNVKIEVVSLPDGSGSEVASGSSTPAWPGSKPAGASQSDTIGVDGERQTLVTEVKKPANEYYKIVSTVVHPKGFGVQLASYQEAANLVKRCAEIKEKIGKDIMIQIGDKNGIKVYRIIAGPFDSRDKAENFNRKLTDFSGSFVVSLE